ncbi:TPA: DUF2892 domain-containing protein [Candidatus Woesearchaeota archaeon]|nr:DUF2892 domain-containing protein [Candidatus Woesearchaeota archaeon]
MQHIHNEQKSDDSREQNIQRYMRRIIGTLVLTSAALAYFVSPYWLLLTAFIGLNLLQFSFTDWCLMQSMLKRMVKR